jgi:hypothetical protein
MATKPTGNPPGRPPLIDGEVIWFNFRVPTYLVEALDIIAKEKGFKTRTMARELLESFIKKTIGASEYEKLKIKSGVEYRKENADW